MLKHRRNELLLILSALMFASNGISSKLLLDGHISAWRLAQVRAIGAASILAIYLWRRAPHTFRATKQEIRRLAALGAFGIAAVNGMYFLAISRMHVSIALLIEFTAPVWIVLYLRFVKRKFVPNQMWVALALALTGLAFVAQVWDGLTLDGIGVIAAFASAIAVAIYFVLNLIFERVNYYRILDPEGGSVASMIIAKFGEATPEEIQALLGAGLVLFILTLVVNLIANWIVARSARERLV